MEGRRGDTELPYGKIAGWGMAASAVVTLGLLALCPLSPGQMVERALEGDLRFGLGGPWPEGAASVGVLAGGETVAGAVGGALDGLRAALGTRGHASGDDLLRGVDPAARERLRRQLRREVRREMRGMAPEIRRAVLEGVLPLLPELSRELDGIRVELGAATLPARPVGQGSI